MILTAHQPAYIPWLGYFHKISLCDCFVILDNVQYEKNSFTNRNKIKTSQGEIWLSVPVLMENHLNKKIRDMEIKLSDNWRDKHWKSLYLNYKKAPYFNYHADFFAYAYKKEWTLLNDLLLYILRYLLKELKINVNVLLQSEIKTELAKQDLIIELCRYCNADAFVFGELGKNYANIDYFKANNIDVFFQNYKHPEYKQLWGEFLPYMSVIDLIFNVGSANASEIILGDNVRKSDLAKLMKTNKTYNL